MERMNIRVITPDLTDVEKLEREYSEPPSSVEGDNAGEINSIAVRQVLDVDAGEYDDEVNTLVKWAQSKGKQDPLEIKWAIRDLRMRLGTPTFGDHIKHLSRFAYLEMEESRIKREKDSFM